MIEVVAGRVKVTGSMLIGAAAELRDDGERALQQDVTMIDLTEVAEADSSAVAVLLAWTRIASDLGKNLSIVGAPQSVRSLAALYGVADLLPLV